MLGFGALGEFAIGEGPTQQASSSFSGGQWQSPIRKTGLAVAVVATTFAGFVPQPPAKASPVFARFSEPERKKPNIQSWAFAPQAPAQAKPVFSRFAEPVSKKPRPESWVFVPKAPAQPVAIFSRFDEMVLNRAPLPDEQPSAFFEVAPPTAPPFFGFMPFEMVLTAKINVALQTSRWWQPITLPVDTHDGIWIKRKKRKSGVDPLDLEREERARRRAAIELAFYGPPEGPAPAPLLEPPPVAQPIGDVTELAKIVVASRQAEEERRRAQELADDEDDIEAILKDIL